MEFWKALLSGIAGGAVGVAIVATVAWIARSAIEHWLKRNLDEAAQLLGHNLGLTAFEHQVRFSKLHERRAEIIAELYELIVDAQRALQSFVAPFEFEGEPTKHEKYKSAMEKTSKLYQFFDRKRVFLPAPLARKIESFLNGMHEKGRNYHLWISFGNYTTKVVDEKAHKAWEEAADHFANDVPEARAALEEELRRILGPT